METSEKNKAYWRKNLQYLAILLGIWFVTSYLCSIVFVEQLDKIQFWGYRLGFYFAQQASIWIFVEVNLCLCVVDEPFGEKICATRR